ncbi:unnamed protein product [Allacma fusca]|uniref:amidase n=2 Tax=Allacma fusca TaxID=39272 RepID=A0A8J2LU13_9HEXA|nr:unnamed protein product [Allacma fusca]
MEIAENLDKLTMTLLNYASDNPVFGITTSCHNQKLGPGGSSSGTGALVGSLGAMFGTGTDIGGSLRIPAHFNGVASLKPTGGRLRCVF